ncbi:hypothetical protein HRH25_18320 [Flavisolibacter sp. BT320]|nr:hypothetical protein [Flavisolibacter longurius]
MSKKKVLFLIPFLLVAGFLLFCWTKILAGDIIATWRHYVGLLLFVGIIFLFFIDFKKSVIGLVVFLLLATFNALAITPAITTTWLNIGEHSTPPIQVPSLGILVLFSILNMETLIDIQLDYKEAKEQKAKVV